MKKLGMVAAAVLGLAYGVPAYAAQAKDIEKLHRTQKHLGKQETTPVTNTIVDFTPGEDKIDVSDYGGFNAVTLIRQGNNTVVELGNGDKLILENVLPEQLRPEDFGMR